MTTDRPDKGGTGKGRTDKKDDSQPAPRQGFLEAWPPLPPQEELEAEGEQRLEAERLREVNRVYLDAELIADTRTGEVQLGFRNLCVNERRMLYQADDAYVELLVPTEGHDTLEGGWLYGQFITPTREARDRHPHPVYAVLVGDKGMTGAARTTPLGDFALPYNDPGEFELMLEPQDGPTIRVRFTQ